MLNIIPNVRGEQYLLQGFYSELFTFNKLINIFEHVEIVDSVYEGVVEPSIKKLTRADFKYYYCISKMRGGSSSKKPNSDIIQTGKSNKSHVELSIG